ncbi:MAG: NADH:ubiquinone reductase (Na(+)-transporting) subunit D [Planctomycetota bacterium]
MDKKTKKILVDPLHVENPITLQVLGICSALAVTTNLSTALVMCGALTFVLLGSNIVISCLRNYIPGSIRIIVQLTVIASLVIVADQVLKAFVYDVSKQLSVFVGLIITNCIVMGRAEAFAMANGPVDSALDGLSNAMGYNIILILVAAPREFFGFGTLLGHPIIDASESSWYVHNGMMVLSPAAFFIIGVLIWIQRAAAPSMVEED